MISVVSSGGATPRCRAIIPASLGRPGVVLSSDTAATAAPGRGICVPVVVGGTGGPTAGAGAEVGAGGSYTDVVRLG
jgi:hypothetical protein